MPLSVGLGVLIRNARIDAGYSGRALARAVGRSHAWLRGLECGERPPSATMAARVSEALRLDPWSDALLQSVAVDDAELRGSRSDGAMTCPGAGSSTSSACRSTRAISGSAPAS
ncbi:helix-turn-helix domain-containing protein [Streptomyces scabiei]|uniref:helix-turn-helix domain-containing protein n=1 Tax=Streptomyces scabiei TaxID=1930 RepID=UPI0039F47FB0